MRTLVDIPEPHLRELDNLSRRERRSRASLIREAVLGYLARKKGRSIEEAYGLWGTGEDGLEYQERLRGEW